MGADIHQERNHALVRGVDSLNGTNLKASDLRAGASLIIAALMADGESEIEALHHIDRGYELLETKFANLGCLLYTSARRPHKIGKESTR